MSIRTNCQRKMVILRNTNSPIFEEAYLILKDVGESEHESVDLLGEANRLLNSRTFRVCEPKAGTKVGWFIIGALTSFAISIAIYLLFLM